MGHESGVSRRTFVRTGSLLGAGLGLSGCTGGSDVEVITPTPDESQDGGSSESSGTSGGVYVPPHVHQRNVAGTTTSGDVAFGLAYSVPDYYWTVDGENVRQVTPSDDANVQVMATMWASGTQHVLPGLEPTATVEQGGESIAEATLVPMLNQLWGVHYAANLGLERYGEFTVRLGTSTPDLRRTGTLQDILDAPASAEIELDFDRTEIQDVRTLYPLNRGVPGAIQSVEDGDIPVGRQREPTTLPGEVVGGGTSADAEITVSAVPPDGSPLDDGNPYLAVSAATPYNRLTLPNMGVEGWLVRDGEPVYEGALPPTLDEERGYHYGAGVDSIEAGDRLRLSFATPPQVARYEGYERAFLRMPDVELTL